MEALIVDFLEENWAVFVMRCEESGMTEDEIEKEMEAFKKKAGLI